MFGGVFIVVSYSFVVLLGVVSLHGLACFPLLTMVSLFPADRPLSRTWSMATQMAWETAKVSRPFSLLSFPRLFHSTPHSSLLCKLSPPLFSAVRFLLRCCHLFCIPSVQPSQSSLSASSIHLSLSARIIFCPSPRCFSGPPGQQSVVSSWAKTGLLLTKHCENTPQTFIDTQGMCFICEWSRDLFRNSKQALQTGSLTVLKSLLVLHSEA